MSSEDQVRTSGIFHYCARAADVCPCFLLVKPHRKCNGRKTAFAELSALHRKECFQLPGSGVRLPSSGSQHRSVSLAGEPDEWPMEGNGHRGIWPQTKGPELGTRAANFTLMHKGLRSDFMRLIRIVIAVFFLIQHLGWGYLSTLIQSLFKRKLPFLCTIQIIGDGMNLVLEQTFFKK